MPGTRGQKTTWPRNTVKANKFYQILAKSRELSDISKTHCLVLKSTRFGLSLSLSLWPVQYFEPIWSYQNRNFRTERISNQQRWPFSYYCLSEVMLSYIRHYYYPLEKLGFLNGLNIPGPQGLHSALSSGDRRELLAVHPPKRGVIW